MSRDRILLAGGSGLVGGALAAALAADGHDVVVLSRAPQRAHGLPPGVRVAGWDGRRLGPWAAEVDGAAAVVNLAGANLAGGRWTAGRKRRLRSSRIEPTRALGEALAAAQRRPAVLVQMSAVGYYGPRGDEEIAEGEMAGSGFLADLGREWEAASAPAAEIGVRRVVARLGVVLAREGGALPKMAWPFRLGIGGRLGSGRQVFSWIHLADAVGALRFLIDRADLAGPVHLTAPEPVTNAELTRELGRALHRPTLFPVPAFALRLLFGELAGTLLTGQRVVPRRLQEAGFTFRFPTLPAALGDLLGRG